MRFAKFINSVNIVHVKFLLEADFDLQKLNQATKQLSKLYNTQMHYTERTTPFATEICYHMHNNTLHMYVNHKYYDGKVLSILASQLDILYKNSQATIKKEFDLQVNTSLPFEIGLQVYNKQMAQHSRTPMKIHDFYDPLSITSVITYIQEKEKKNIIMLRAHKTTTEAKGENYSLMVIRKHQNFKDAMANPEQCTMKKMPLLVPFVFVNIYTKFHRPSFCSEWTFDTNLFSITSAVQLCRGEFYTLYTQTSAGNYPLYIG